MPHTLYLPLREYGVVDAITEILKTNDYVVRWGYPKNDPHLLHITFNEKYQNRKPKHLPVLDTIGGKFCLLSRTDTISVDHVDEYTEEVHRLQGILGHIVSKVGPDYVI